MTCCQFLTLYKTKLRPKMTETIIGVLEVYFEGFMAYTAAYHQGLIKTFWHHFGNLS